MDLEELEEFLNERLHDFVIDFTKKGEVIIRTGLIHNKMTNELVHRLDQDDLEEDDEDSDEESDEDF